MFQLQSSYSPAGDQIRAIDDIQHIFAEGKNKVTLL